MAFEIQKSPLEGRKKPARPRADHDNIGGDFDSVHGILKSASARRRVLVLALPERKLAQQAVTHD